MEDVVGFGALGEAFADLAKEGFRKILVVASAEGWRRFNAGGEREFFSSSGGRETRLFHAFSPNPDFTEIEAAAALAKDFQPDLLFALGGGSAIDVAKGIKAFAYAAVPYDVAAPQSVTAVKSPRSRASSRTSRTIFSVTAFPI